MTSLCLVLETQKDAALRDNDTELQNLLEHCHQKHITLNKDKLKFKLHELSCGSCHFC